MSRLLAIDQASVTSGWSIWEDGKLIKWGKFSIEENDLGKRLQTIK
jgi:hypothetical protein